MRHSILVAVVFFLVSGCSSDVNYDLDSSQFSISEEGHLFYEDKDLGKVRGDAGQDGVNGVDGENGRNGINGTNGKDGLDGKNGVDGITYEQPTYFKYYNLNNFSIGDQIPFIAGLIPFTWNIDEETWINVSNISLTLVNKLDYEQAKNDFNYRELDTYFPFKLHLQVSGTASSTLSNTHNIVVLFTDGQAGYGSSGNLTSSGTFEIDTFINVYNYKEFLLNRVYFEECDQYTDCSLD